MLGFDLNLPVVDTGPFVFAAPRTPTTPHAGRDSLLAFTRHTMPGYAVNWHHELVCEYLDRFARLEMPRLMLFMPPRHGKSELVSRRLPAYILGRNPDAPIIAASYGADLARRMNRDVQRIIDSDGYRQIFPQTRLSGQNVRTLAQGTWLRNSDTFEVVEYNGVYRSSGVGGSITGMGMLYGIIDDPVKNRAEANSETYRDRVWEWYTSTFLTRLAPGGAILLTVTRWHEDDLAGRLLKLAEDEPDSDQWTVLTLPALAEDGAPGYDQREAGEALWPTKYDAELLTKTRLAVGSYEWNALYQQRPRPPEGGMFQRPWFAILPAAPIDAQRVRYWDKAGTAGDGDYSVGVLMGKRPDGRFFVEDVLRGQWSSGQREAVMKQTAQLDNAKYGHVAIWHEQEPGSGGKDSAAATTRNLSGFAVYSERVTGDKLTRAQPFAAQCEAGNVDLVAGPWNATYLDELTTFPNGAHDDQVDGSSGAFGKLADTYDPVGMVDFADYAPRPGWAGITDANGA